MNMPVEPGYLNEPDRQSEPPHSLESEQSVLGGLLIDNVGWDRVVDVVAATDFYRYEHREIFAVIKGLLAAGEPVDVVTAHTQLVRAGMAEKVGGLAYLNSLANSVPSASNVGSYARRVKEFATRRDFQKAAREIDGIAKGSNEVGPDLDRACDLLGKLQQKQTVSGPTQLFDVAVEVLTKYEQIESGTEPAAWSTCIQVLNQFIAGLMAGCLYIIAARPSVGKSSFTQFVVQELASRGFITLFQSLEMPKERVGERAIAMRARVPLTGIKRATLTHDEFSRAAKAAEEMSGIPFAIDDQSGLTIAQIRSKARATKGLKILVVDYLQLCSGSGDKRNANRNSEIEEISRGLKTLAKDLGIAVIALSQLSREVETRNPPRPRLSDLRDSGSIEQDADSVLFLWPVRDLPNGHKLIGCDIGKNRDGPCGELLLEFDGALQQWNESYAMPETPAPAALPGAGRKPFKL